MQGAAKVVKLYGSGRDILTQAIEQGLVSADVRREIERLVDENAQLRRAICLKQSKLMALEAVEREHRQIGMAARAQYMREREARHGARGARRAKAVGLLALGVMAGAAVVSLFAMRIIGGMA